MSKDRERTHQHLDQEIEVLRGRLAVLKAAEAGRLAAAAEAGRIAAEEQAESLAAIGRLAIELASAPPEVDALPILAEALRSISGAMAVGISLYDAGSHELVVRTIVPGARLLPRVAQILGRDLIGVRVPVSHELYQEMVTEVIRIQKSLWVTLFGAIPRAVADTVQKALGIDHFAGLALCHGGELLGSAVLVMPGKAPSPPVEALQLFAHLAAAWLRRRQAEEALRESEERYRTLVETSPDGIVLLDLSGAILMINQQMLKLYGGDGEELLGQRAPEFLAPAEQPRAWQGLATLTERKSFKADVYHLPHKDGGSFPAAIRATLVEDASGQPQAALIVVRDITEEQRMEKALQQRNLELEMRMGELRHTQAQLIQSAKMAAVGELAAGVAHELNNPLNSVLASAELLLERAELEGRDRERMEAIARQAGRARDIIRNLLDFARQRGTLCDWADVNQVLGDSLSLLRQRLQNGGITLVENYAPGLPPLLLNASQIKEVFLSLVLNALQAMPAGGRLVVRTEQRGDRVAVTFADDGEGIADDVLPRIFEPFYTTRPVGQGTGLGLSVSLGIVQDHGGTMQVESQLGEGATFVVWLPLPKEREDLDTPLQSEPAAR
ncbi:MAG: PAS domain S-box protein [Anaerolineae bacterium]